MEKKELLEGNKLVAKFMGAVPEQWYPESKMYNQSGIHYAFPYSGLFPDNTRHHHEEMLKYHSSWDWLMPVIKKILDTTFEEGSPFVQDDYNAVVDNIPDIEATWRGVVEFVKTFNLEVYGK